MGCSHPDLQLGVGTALWGPTFCVCFRVSRWISRPTGQTVPWTSPPEVTWAPWSQRILNKLSTLPQLPTATSPDMFPIPVTSTPPSPTPEIFALFLTPPSRHSSPNRIKDHVPGSWLLLAQFPSLYNLSPGLHAGSRMTHTSDYRRSQPQLSSRNTWGTLKRIPMPELKPRLINFNLWGWGLVFS